VIDKDHRTLKDGSVRMRHPVFHTESFFVPGRNVRPIFSKAEEINKDQSGRRKEHQCPFCEANLLQTTPEKERAVKSGDAYCLLKDLLPSSLFKTRHVVRCIPNLFEIISFEYWKKNHGLSLNAEQRKRMKGYLSDRQGRKHLKDLVEYKLGRSGLSRREIKQLNKKRFLQAVEPFFGGSHCVVVARRHSGLKGETPVPFSAGMLPETEHEQYFLKALRAAESIYSANRFVRYVAVFQNWLRMAGASFDHLHKQIVGVDFIGKTLDLYLRKYREDRNALSRQINAAKKEKRLVAENETGVIFADGGRMYPSITLSVKRASADIFKAEKELCDMARLAHGAHAVLGTDMPCNEEWFLPPRKHSRNIPFQINISLRSNAPAGFENITGIYVHEYAPYMLGDMFKSGLKALLGSGKISPLYIHP
jgi:galactose-1-phosphate uridylyltransferase